MHQLLTEAKFSHDLTICKQRNASADRHHSKFNSIFLLYFYYSSTDIDSKLQILKHPSGQTAYNGWIGIVWVVIWVNNMTQPYLGYSEPYLLSQCHLNLASKGYFSTSSLFWRHIRLHAAERLPGGVFSSK